MRTMGVAERANESAMRHLTKHHGLGNDFLISLVAELPDDAADMAIALCNRSTGVGADGLIFGIRTSEADAQVRFVLHNADGGRAEVSGNGLRCLGQALAMQAGVGELEVEITTDAGHLLLTIWPTDDPLVSLARVDMGPPSAGPSTDGVPIADYVPAKRIGTVDMGNPHVVIEVDEPMAFDMAVVGPAVEAHFMPTGANVHLISGATPTSLTMNIWERGAGVTEACGSGACAAAVVATSWDLCEPNVDVNMPGGAARVEVSDSIHLIGPATFVARVELPNG